MKSREERNIDEFCKAGGLEPYRHLVTRIFHDLEAQGVLISARYDVGFSNFEDWDEQTGHKRIRISLKNVTIPLDVIWVLFHEFGHFLSLKARFDDNVIEREELAWAKADELLKNYPELMPEGASYQACKRRCLNSYYRDHGLPEI